MSISGVAGAPYAWASAGVLMKSAPDQDPNSARLPGQPDAPVDGSQDSVILSTEAKKLDSSSRQLGTKSDANLSEQERREVEN